MYILSSSSIYNMEKSADEKLEISFDILMENAGISVSNFIKNNNFGKKAAVLAGPGNNGGDGFVTARHLISAGYDVDIYYMFDNNKYQGASSRNLNILKNINADLRNIKDFANNNYNIIIDALFGTGLKRDITDEYKKVIDKANSIKAYKISIDIPSGLKADSSEVSDTVFKADTTITFSCLKYCLCLFPAKKYAGKIITADITIPKSHIEVFSSNVLINKNNLPPLKKREIDGHKGTFGRVVCAGGSEDMAGALKIAALSALSSGCGLVSVFHPDNLNRNFISDIPEIMTKSYNYNEPEIVVDFINKYAQCYTLGNGMGQNSLVKDFILYILKNADIPVVIDADAINALTLDDLTHIKGDAVITPHLKEFSRLMNISIENIKSNKINIAEDVANKYNITLILKSADTIIACPKKAAYILNEGNTALAKGGSGDALTGLTASLIAQGNSIENACILACYILGKSAEYAVSSKNASTVYISQIIEEYSKVFNEL